MTFARIFRNGRRRNRPASRRKFAYALWINAFAVICIGLPAVAAGAETVAVGDDELAVATPRPAPAYPLPDNMTMEIPAPESVGFHAQSTVVKQYHPGFSAIYSGANSLDPVARWAQTVDLTLFLGLRLGDNTEFWINPEIDQGSGLNNTLGVAGFPSGEAYKVGANVPYVRVPRAFFRRVIDLGGETLVTDSGPNQLAGTHQSDNLTITAGKFAVVDIFDTNTYAHDPRADFLNWAVIESGAFDYAADSWGYTYGAATEWNVSRWTLRGGVFALSETPNGKKPDASFRQQMFVAELERRHQWREHDGKLKLLAFINRANMASYADAVRAAALTGGTPDVSTVRRFASRPGIALNFEQEVTADLGVFARASMNDGSKESFDFTDINKSVSGGFALKGTSWNRPRDTLGVAAVINGLSGDAQSYFANGGLGVLVGDGQLNYRTERILETYYALQLDHGVAISLDYQYVQNPAYNRDRGPVSLFGIRLHADFR